MHPPGTLLKKGIFWCFSKILATHFSSAVPGGCTYCGVTKFGLQSCFRTQRTFFIKFWYHMTFSLFLSKFWKSRNFGDFGHFSTNFACGTHFQEVPERGLGVFQANVAIWQYKTCILTGSTQNPAPKRICTQMAHPVPHAPENALFEVPFFN